MIHRRCSGRAMKFPDRGERLRDGLIIGALIGFAAAFIGCGNGRTHVVADLSKAALIQLVAEPGQTNIQHLRLRIRGHLDRDALIHITNVVTRSFKDSFTRSYEAPWHSSECFIRYVPNGPNSGALSIDYEFLE